MTRDEQIREVVNLLAMGCPPSRIATNAAKQGFEADAELVEAARSVVVADAQDELPGADYAQAIQIHRLRTQYAIAVGEEDRVSALAITKTIDRIIHRSDTERAPRPATALPQADAARLLLAVGRELAEVRRPGRKALTIVPAAEVRTDEEQTPEPCRIRAIGEAGCKRTTAGSRRRS